MTRAGVVSAFISESYFLTPRDAFRTDTTTHTDVAVNYALKVGVAKGLELFCRGTAINPFNQQGIANAGAVDQSVLTANNNSRLQPFNPFVVAAIRGANWEEGPSFGHALTRLAYQTPRTYGFSVGLRF